MVVTLVLAVGDTPLWKESAVPAWQALERPGGTASRSVVETWWVNCGVRVLDLEGFFVCGRCRKGVSDVQPLGRKKARMVTKREGGRQTGTRCARRPSTRVRIVFGEVGIATERMAA